MDEIIRLDYASVSGAMSDTDKPLRSKHNTELRANHLTSNRDNDWLGINGGAAAVLAAIRDGYPEGEARIHGFYDQIVAKLPRAQGYLRTKKRGDFGDELDIHSVNRGSVDKAWTTSTRQVKRGSGIIRLVIDIGANSSYDADSLQLRGVAGLALTKVMIKAGYSVEIVAAFAGRNFIDRNPATYCMTVIVKPRHVQADYGLLAATVGLPGFFRTIGFAGVIRVADNMREHASDTLGFIINVDNVLTVPDKVTQIIVPSDIVNEQSAIKWVKSTITLLQGA